MTEELGYEVVEHLPGGVELRRYPAHGVAEVTVRGSLGGAGNSAFAPLFSYISGSNRPRTSVAMTAPVVQQPAARRGERVAMTAPVVQEEAGAGSAAGGGASADAGRSFTVSFVLPAGMTAETAPQPTDDRVSLRTVPPSLSAAVRYSGRWSASAYEKHRDRCSRPWRRRACTRSASRGGCASTRRSHRGSCATTRWSSTSPSRHDREATGLRGSGPPGILPGVDDDTRSQPAPAGSDTAAPGDDAGAPGARDVLAQARAAVAEGREWQARERLVAHLADTYDPAALELLGEVQFAMRDLPAAGAAWFGTARRGEDVDAAIDAWRERYADHFPEMWLSLPAPVREHEGNKRVDALRRRAVPAPTPAVQPAAAVEAEASGGFDAAVVVALVLAGLFVVCAVVGFVTVLKWLVP